MTPNGDMRVGEPSTSNAAFALAGDLYPGFGRAHAEIPRQHYRNHFHHRFARGRGPSGPDLLIQQTRSHDPRGKAGAISVGDAKSPRNLVEVLERIAQSTPDTGRVPLSSIVEVVGRRSFGPLLLVAGLVTLAPVIGDVPGVPTIVGLVVFLLAIQLIVGRECLWLPRWLLKKSAPADKLHKALKWLGKPARFVDGFLKSRLAALTEGRAVRVISSRCCDWAASTTRMSCMELRLLWPSR